MFRRIFVIALAFILPTVSSCSMTEKASAVDGAGFAMTNLKRESTAYLINNDLDAYTTIRGNNEVCARMSGCLK